MVIFWSLLQLLLDLYLKRHVIYSGGLASSAFKEIECNAVLCCEVIPGYKPDG